MKFWPIPPFRVHETEKRITDLFLMFSDTDDLKIIKEEPHHVTIRCKHGTMRFWDANHYYGWASDGEFSGTDGTSARWNRQMPSRYAVREMRKALEGKLVEPTE